MNGAKVQLKRTDQMYANFIVSWITNKGYKGIVD